MNIIFNNKKNPGLQTYQYMLESLKILYKFAYYIHKLSCVFLFTIKHNKLFFVVDIETGKCHLIFASPEAITTRWWNWIKRARSEVCLLAIDEAHCLTKW